MAADQSPRGVANRDSHDLSLSPRDVTRDSLVANMLLSLDQLSLAQHKTMAAYDAPTWASAVRPRPETPPARARRHAARPSPGGSVDAARAAPPAPHRDARTVRRSVSLDFAPPPPLQQLALSSPFHVDFPGGRADDYDDADDADADADDDGYCAAPTPTVPSGPRRLPSAGLCADSPRLAPPPPPPPPEPAASRAVERTRSVGRSLKSPAALPRRSGGHRAGTPAGGAPAMPPAHLDAAPAPRVGYRKAREAHAPATAPAPPRERPGFFRRVFGGGSSKNSSACSSSSYGGRDQASSRLPASPERPQRPGSRAHGQLHASPSKTGAAPPSRDTASSLSNHHPPLQKKTSSFFRRRKKSAADEQPPPPSTDQPPPLPPLDAIGLQTVKERSTSSDESPTSSLRDVMNPYLTQGGAGAGLGLSNAQAPATPLTDMTNTPRDRPAGHVGRPDFKRGFSPDYEPGPNARIRTVPCEGESGHGADGAAGMPSRMPPRRQRAASETGDSSSSELDAGSDGEHDSRDSKRPAEEDKGNDVGDQDADATVRAGKKHTFAAALEQADRPSSRPKALAAEGMRAVSLASGSTETDYKTAPSAAPSVRIESASGEPGPKVLGTLGSMQAGEAADEAGFVGAPTDDDRHKAHKIYAGSDDFVPKDKAASWMGEAGAVRQRTLQAYMELYDFKDQSILSALRGVCGRLVLRAETQQVDRILMAFSKRWCACNPQHGFKATDVVHTICYSIMLLNTDLHLADIEQKMTRSQFVKNTMTTIAQAVAESAPHALGRLSILPEKRAVVGGGGEQGGRLTPDPDRANRRHSFLARTDGAAGDGEDCGPLVRAPFGGPMRAWEEQVEAVLKNIYASIRDGRLPLFGAGPDKHAGPAPSQSSLSVAGMLKRSPSVLSKAPSETQLSSRGRVADGGRTGGGRWASKSRSRPGLGRNGFSSSRTSLDDGSSAWSPAMSSSATWSRYSLGRTQGSMSQDSFAPSLRRGGDYQQSIGFANALSQAIVRDEEAGGPEAAPSMVSADTAAAQLLDDESLELAGPPWVKEGMVMHKHHLDGVGKKARDRNWSDVFAVVEKGRLSLFSFAKSARHQAKGAKGKPSGPVGGGNWQDRAVGVGSLSLRLTLASSLPPPGYSRSRPYVWALSMPTGAVHLFQVGTPDVGREFVHTANYWSARLSTHPLVGGISNVEYGWSEAVVNHGRVVGGGDESAAAGSAAAGGGTAGSRPGSSLAHGHGHGHARRSSVAGSLRASSLDQAAGSLTHGGRGKLPGDGIHIAEWAPPAQSMRPSRAAEAKQLEALEAYVKSIEDEVQAHNRLRSPMLLAFTPRGHNAVKAMANWERKSAYLLRENVKFRTYVDCLHQAEACKAEVYAEREEPARKASRGESGDEDEGEGDETLRPS